jgi:tryptophanyl-tRNA synthetase
MKMIPRYKALYISGAVKEDLPMMDEALSRIESKDGGYGFLPPSSTYHRFIRGLTGEKMSSSKPETAIFLDDEVDIARKKMMKAITGGRESAEEQKEKGGDPEVCAVFETMLFHTIEDDDEIARIQNECRNGERLCGQCKKEAAQHLQTFLEDLKERRDETQHLIDEFVHLD